MFKDLLNITKPRLAMLNLVAAYFGFAMSGVTYDIYYFLESMLYIALVIAGAGALNCLMEIDVDGRMARTKSRPLPSGRLGPKQVLIFGGSLIFFGSLGLLLRVNILTGVISLSSAIFYLVFYTPMKVKTPYAVFVGAIPGALPPVIGYTAASATLTEMAMVLFVFLFAWQIPHFLAISIYSREDYAKAGVIVYPNKTSVRHTISLMNFYTSLTVVASLVPVFINKASTAYGAVGVLLGLCFQVICVKGYQQVGDTEKENIWAKKCFVASIIYLPLLLTSMFLL